MSKRPTLVDLAEAAGVSVATVDRVLNARHRVRESTAERVLGAAERIGFHAAPLLKRRLRPEAPTRTFGFLLQKPDGFYRQLGADLEAATARLTDCRGRAQIDFVDEISPTAICAAMLRMADRADAIGVVSIDHPRVSETVATLAARAMSSYDELVHEPIRAALSSVGQLPFLTAPAKPDSGLARSGVKGPLM